METWKVGLWMASLCLTVFKQLPRADRRLLVFALIVTLVLITILLYKLLMVIDNHPGLLLKMF